jgi:hypothetical protein
MRFLFSARECESLMELGVSGAIDLYGGVKSAGANYRLFGTNKMIIYNKHYLGA